ncbi:unnamed protein product [Ambrosiozyma monospora]|uniref:Unnamed protein product n=1 Tax=Ambrosiozyma monospora TaxID=43982 RepID=A0ACB5TZX7_AMBMO|nr:unnamed protein product [Ambrosiozyma monospora]
MVSISSSESDNISSNLFKSSSFWVDFAELNLHLGLMSSNGGRISSSSSEEKETEPSLRDIDRLTRVGFSVARPFSLDNEMSSNSSILVGKALEFV